MFTNENAFNAIIDKESTAQGVPVVLIKAVIGTESSFNPNAFREEKTAAGVIWDTSYGLMQLLFRTAVALGFPDDRSRYLELMKPEVNIHYGTKLLKQLIGRYGFNPKDIYAAYNAGSVRKNEKGEYTNSKGDTAVNARVNRFYGIYEYFLRQQAIEANKPYAQEVPPGGVDPQ